MPAERRTSGRKAATQSRVEPYPTDLNAPETDKENQAPNSKPAAEKAKTAKAAKDAKAKKASHDADKPNLPSDYLAIPLEEIMNEVPIYDNVRPFLPSLSHPLTDIPQCATIRRKLTTLIQSPSNRIPGTNKKWSKAALCAEMRRLASMNHPIPCHNGQIDDTGPSVQALTRFLGHGGQMRGADSASYYWGNMLLEKVRVWKGEKETEGRRKARVE